MCGCNQPDDPEITGFSTPQVRAGTGEILTVFGNHFGDVIIDGSSFIEVDNADDTDQTQIPFVDIIDWTNTAITFIVPSTTSGLTKKPMESGPVEVFNACDDSNKMSIDVEYAVFNIRDDSDQPAKRVGLEKQTANGIKFTIGGNVGGFEQGLVNYAIDTWCASSNIRWYNGGGTNITVVDATDGLNLIVETDPNDGLIPTDTEAAVIRYGLNDQSYQGSCDDEKSLFVKNIDVLINKNTNFSNMNLAEARRIILHEFGHAHNLDHAAYINPTGQKLMYHTAAFNNFITTEDLNGAVSVFDASAIILTGTDCPVSIDQGLCTNATDDLSQVYDINISPIPFYSEITIQVKEDLPKGTILRIYSSIGQPVKSIRVQGNQSLTISNLENLPNGLYLLALEGEHINWNQKIIKISK